MSATLIQTELVHITCCNCGVAFGLDDDHYKRLRASHDWFYCPNGHQQHFTGKTEAERLREQLAAAERLAIRERNAKEEAQRRAVSAEMSRRVTKGHLTRTKRRVAAGVCPCCNRTFENLARHMKGQHPDFGGDL